MSMYKRFVDAPPEPSVAKSTGHLNQMELEISHRQSGVIQRQKSCVGGRAPVVRLSDMRLSPMLSSLSTTLSSTPISCVARNNYKRMVPADEFDFGRQQAEQIPITQQETRATGAQLSAHPTSSSHSIYQQSNQLKQRHQKQLHRLQQQQQQQPIQMTASCYSLNQSRRPMANKESNYSVTPPKCNSSINSAQRRRALVVSPPSVSPSRPSPTRSADIESVFKTDDPVLLAWMRAMRFDTELECLTALQARTMAIDENLAGALSVRNSQVAIQEMRLESDYILELADILIDMLPINFNSIDKFALEFSNLWTLLTRQTEARTRTKLNTYTNCQKDLTIINCTPRKSLASARTMRPLDELANKIRCLCIELANAINSHQECYQSAASIDNGNFEATLRRIKELFGKFVEIFIRAECANIVRALDFDFVKQMTNDSKRLSTLGTSKLENVASSASLRPARVYESSSSQLPLKWALIALWQLTKEDAYICRLLTEMWQTGGSACNLSSSHKSAAARRLDYSTNGDEQAKVNEPIIKPLAAKELRALKPSEICQRFCENQQVLLSQQQQKQYNQQQGRRQETCSQSGALSSALKSKQPSKQLSTIELLIDIIISQPNKHERVDMMNFLQNSKLVEVEQLDKSVSAAFYTSNQYKVAALRILNQLCINEQAIKTILRCFSTPPPKVGQPAPQNKIIKSIFECYQVAQEHIYQNETVFNPNRTPRRARKRARQVLDDDEYSDYGSRQTNSVPTSDSQLEAEEQQTEEDDEDDDAVVKEAIRLLIQLTTVFHRSNQGHDYYTLIGRFSIESLVKYLTNIIKSASNREMILLSLSALANISFITTEPMKSLGTNRVILDMFQGSKVRSKDLELRDQTVTILANMADKNAPEIQSDGSLAFLLSCLEVCPSRMANYRLIGDQLRDGSHPYARIGGSDSSDNYSFNPRRFNIENKPRDRKPIQMGDEFFDDLDCSCDNQQQSNMPMLCLSRLRPSELAALERIHQKTCVAFARLSNDSDACRMVLKQGGIKQMIDLCKLSNRRNHSDTVLIACLTALRKLAKVVGHEVFRHYNALDLIELELNHALEIYGHVYASEV